MKKKEKIAILEQLSEGISPWMQEAEERFENAEWLKLSREIALQVLMELDKQKLSQKDLAGKMKVSPQQINKILTGKENLTLKTIAKLEKALQIQIIVKSATKESEEQKPLNRTKIFTSVFHTSINHPNNWSKEEAFSTNFS
jgi:transcriptional regulator with XRE-family HTH domain